MTSVDLPMKGRRRLLSFLPCTEVAGDGCVSGIPSGQISGLNYHPDGSRLGLRIGTSRTAGDVYPAASTQNVSKSS